jgi:hypothetical protein
MRHAAPVAVRDLSFQKLIRHDQRPDRRPEIAVTRGNGLGYCDL